MIATRDISVTVSIGIAIVEPTTKLATVVKSADAARCQAKRAGVNCVFLLDKRSTHGAFK
jgi:GGDEF domain-containing protein